MTTNDLVPVNAVATFMDAVYNLWIYYLVRKCCSPECDIYLVEVVFFS